MLGGPIELRFREELTQLILIPVKRQVPKTFPWSQGRGGGPPGGASLNYSFVADAATMPCRYIYNMQPDGNEHWSPLVSTFDRMRDPVIGGQVSETTGSSDAQPQDIFHPAKPSYSIHMFKIF